MRPALIALLIACLLSAGCQTPPYQAQESTTEQIGENGLRYGSIAAAGVGGYFAGQAVGKSPAWGAVGAGGGVIGSYLLWKMIDMFRGGSYKAGLVAGAAQVRADMLQKKWERSAIYGLPEEGKAAVNQPTTRREYVPTRWINGVEYAGGFQTVEVVYPQRSPNN